MESKKDIVVLSASEIINITGGNLINGNSQRFFFGVSTDSRQIKHGNLFIPLKGERYDGHDFLSDVAKDGAAGFLVQKGSEDKLIPLHSDITVIQVDDTLTSLGDIANYWRRKFTIPVAAITGSSGKTTTKEMTAHIVSLSKNVLKAEGSFNNFVGVPLTIFKLQAVHEVLILELGTNRRGEIKRLTNIAEPDIGLITNIGPAHLEELKTLDTVRDEKCDLFLNMPEAGVAIVNIDDERLGAHVATIWRGEKITFGLNKDADISAEEIGMQNSMGISFTLRINENRKKVYLSLAGMHNVYNALAAAAVSRALGIDISIICEGLASFKSVSGRMEIIRLKNGAFLINDTYNANPASVSAAIKTLKDLKGNGKTTVILGDMLELGERAWEMHEEIGGLIGETKVDNIIIRGDFSKAIAAGALKKNVSKDAILFLETPDEILMNIKECLKEGDWILLKGSRKMKMEEITKRIIKEFGTEEIAHKTGGKHN